jgi:hypothetical protein
MPAPKNPAERVFFIGKTRAPFCACFLNLPSHAALTFTIAAVDGGKKREVASISLPAV